MKKNVLSVVLLSLIMIFSYSCRQNAVKENKLIAEPVSGDTTGFLLLGRDIVTEVVLKPDTTGDPWEVEKVRNYNGSAMYKDLFNKIYKNEITVYDILTGKPLTAVQVKDIAKEFDNDLSKIGKLQFLEDWYFDPSSDKIIKKLKSTTFAYEFVREKGFPPAFKPLFRMKM